MAGTLGLTQLKPDTTVAHPSLVFFFFLSHHLYSAWYSKDARRSRRLARNTEYSDGERGGGINNEGRALGGALATLHAQGWFGVPWGIWRSSIINHPGVPQ